jgi:hypothetical protein
MQNAEVRFAFWLRIGLFKSSFCILHSSFCIYSRSFYADHSTAAVS